MGDQGIGRSPGDAKYALLNENPIAGETFASDKGSPLMAHTVAKAAATAAGAAGSVRQLPSVLKPPLITLRTLTLSGYRVVSLTKGIARSTIIAGALLLVLGVAAAIQSVTVFGVTGLIAAGTGGLLVVLGTWQVSGRLLLHCCLSRLSARYSRWRRPSYANGCSAPSSSPAG